jgi:hypothetical protein
MSGYYNPFKITSEGYYYIFYSNDELIHYKETLVGINNRITKFVNELIDNKFTFNQSLDKFLTFKNINSIFYNGFRLKYDGTKLKYNSFDNPKMNLAINLIKNKKIANIISEKINISSIFNKSFDEIKSLDKKKEKIIKLIDEIKSLDEIKNKEKKIKFIQNLFINKNFIFKKSLVIKNINNLLSNKENTQLNLSNKMYLNCKNNNIKIINNTKKIQKKCFSLKKNISQIENLDKDALNIIKYLRKKFSINIDSYLIINVKSTGNKFIHNKIFEINDNLQVVNILEIKNTLVHSITNEKNELNKIKNQLENSISKNSESFSDILNNKIILQKGGSFVSLTSIGAIISGLVLFILGCIGMFFCILITKIKNIISRNSNNNNEEANKKELERRKRNSYF